MPKLAIVTKASIDKDFPAAAAETSAAPVKPRFVQQQQYQDPEWLAKIKREQQEQSGRGDLFGFNY